jgi:glycosyltransferase involved in cell wall biosynthesis
MRVAILVKEFPPDVIGGTETQTKRLAEVVQQQTDHEVTVFTKSYTESDTFETEYELVRVPTWHASPVISTLTFLLGSLILLLWRHQEFDVLQSMMVYPTGFIGYLCSVLVGLPYFAWIRGGDYYFMKQHRIKRRLISTVLADTLVLVQTDRVRDDVLSEFPEANIRVLGNGVDIPDVTADGDKVVFVGRLEEQKGVHVLLNSVADLNEQLLIVGDGSERDALEKQAVEQDVDAEFVGEVPPSAVTEQLRDGKIFVLPSVRGEGLPNAVLEAMAVGLPVVVTDTGGVADSVQAGETGYVVNTEDETQLREGIKAVNNNKTEMGEEARKYIKKNYCWEKIVSELNKIYSRTTDIES